MAKVLLLLVAIAILATLCLATQSEARRNNRRLDLLKPETNTIDHGPIHRQLKPGPHLLGHPGEHWSAKRKRKLARELRMKEKKKKMAEKNRRQRGNNDDIRLQDLTYDPQPTTMIKEAGDVKATKAPIKASKVDPRKASHSKKYMKKLKQYKAKLLAKKRRNNKKKGHGKKNMRP